MIDMREMNKDQVRTKNIIHPKPTINRGPKSPTAGSADDDNHLQEVDGEDDDDPDFS